jgi:hypothetical protein
LVVAEQQEGFSWKQVFPWFREPLEHATVEGGGLGGLGGGGMDFRVGGFGGAFGGLAGFAAFPAEVELSWVQSPGVGESLVDLEAIAEVGPLGVCAAGFRCDLLDARMGLGSAQSCDDVAFFDCVAFLDR